ncbi:MAG TPA: adenylyl-sulfate kinase [Ktedonobacteraceae bacterium]|nr:adenylyl-sulfate kinase [Ktedonobacteraceae bacterium]
MNTRVPVMFITGPVGAGKTTVAAGVSELLESAGIAHAFVDIDSLRWYYPSPAHDRFRTELAMKNLAAVWANFQAAGIPRLVLADVLESREDLVQYRTAVAGADILVVRLQAALATLLTRLRIREIGTGLDWHLRRAAVLSQQMDRDKVEDILVDTDGKSVAAVAREILTRSKWVGKPDVS